MSTFAIVVAGLVLSVGVALYLVAKRALEFKQLVEDGVDASARVVDKFRAGRAVSAARNRHLRYAYRDAQGNEHRHRMQVTSSVWQALEVGDAIDIVYSRSKPHVSAPRYLVDPARAATAKKQR